MTARPVTHPSADVLRAFALGKLNDPTIEAVMSHLDSCPDCCKQGAALSGDGFLNRLRQAHGRSSTTAPAKSLCDVVRAPQPAPRRIPIANLPPELAANQQYEILRELGRGGMGVVYLAKNKLMDRLEVLKVVNKTLLDHPGAVERFLREIRSAAKLSHANVVGAYSALQMGELLAFAMEYVEGQDLASLVKSQGPLPVQHACFYVQQAASGLQHAFEKQMVHRDIKPQNLILAREGKRHIVKVLDFGLAKVMREKSEDTGLTGEGKMLGTPDYIAPEQTLDAAKADIRADIYSLGCTLYYLLSGHPPFSAASLGAILLAHQMQEAKPLNLVRPEVPEELAAVVRKMMAKTPAKRYQTPLEVVQALSPFVKQGPTRVDPPPTPAAKEAKQPKTAAVWETLTESSAAPVVSRKSAIVRKSRAATVRERTSQKKWLLGGGIGVGVLLLALLGMWAGGVFGVKTQVKTKDGILIVEVNEPNPDVLVDGERVTVTWHNGGKKAEIGVKPGTHKVEIQKDGFSVDGTELSFKDGDKVIFTARLLPEKHQKNEAKTVAPPPDPNKPDVPRIARAADDDRDFVTLFNGKDLTGWKTHPKQPGNWRVEKGILIGWPGETSHLYTERGDYKDFHLRMEVRSNGEHNGVWFRAPFGPTVGPHPFGYNAKFYGLFVPPWGSPVNRVRETAVPRDEWVTFEVLAEGSHLTVLSNGTTVAKVLDNNFGSGHIALQEHGSKVEYRKIQIKELPATKSEASPAIGSAASQSPARRADSALPPETKAAVKAFDKAREDARAKLLAEFDTALDQLAKLKGSTQQRLRLIEAVKEEKLRFENSGLIPWSEPMRPYLAKYFLSISKAEEELRRAYSSLIDAQLRAKKESTIADLQADLTKVIGVRLLARWRHFLNGRPQGVNCLYSNGTIHNIINGNVNKGTWIFANGVFTHRWPDPKAPGGAWIDTLKVSADGIRYEGSNQQQVIKLLGEYER